MHRKKIEVTLSDNYILFRSGEINPKGGVYTINHLTNVYLVDEKIIGIITDETRCYYRVRVCGERYPLGIDGRLKKKHLVKPKREFSSK